MISVGGGSIRPSFCLMNLLLYECASADVSDMLTSLPSAEVTTTIKHILAIQYELDHRLHITSVLGERHFAKIQIVSISA